MSSTTKIALSADELALVTNAAWILTKHRVIQKAHALLSERIPFIQAAFNAGAVDLPAEVSGSLPRIFKGENYLELPYVILDYPRCFEKEAVFAVRTMFWWANFFSITLHLSGRYKTKYIAGLVDQLREAGNDIFICVSDNQWQHHFEESNFVAYHQLNADQYTAAFTNNSFIKLAIKFDLSEWNAMDELLNKGYEKIATLLV